MNALAAKWELIRAFTLLDIKARYRRSYLGIVWSLAQPAVMLATYAFLFHYVMKPRWRFAPDERELPYTLVLFCGIILFNVLSETLHRSPTLLAAHAGYVKKAVFPLEILPIIVVGSALVQFAVNLAVLLAGMLLLGYLPSRGLALLPLILLPLTLISLGLSWFASAAGAFFRDLGHAMPFVVQILFFLTPVLYPAEALPPSLASALKLNVLTVLVDGGRGAALFGKPLDWAAWSASMAAAAILCLAGYAFFMRCRPDFADAI